MVYAKGRKGQVLNAWGAKQMQGVKALKAEKGSPTQERPAVLELVVIWRGTGEVVNERERLVCA